MSMAHRWCWLRCKDISCGVKCFFSRGFPSTSIMLSVYIPCFYLLFHFSRISLLPPRVWHKAAVFVLPSNAFKLLFLWLTCLWFCGTESRHLYLSSVHMCLHVCVTVLLLCQTILLATFNIGDEVSWCHVTLHGPRAPNSMFFFFLENGLLIWKNMACKYAYAVIQDHK